MKVRWFLTRVLVIGLPIVEILLIFWVAHTIGWGWTIVLLLAGIGVGLGLMRAAGVNAFRAIADPARRHQAYSEIDETTGVAQTVHPSPNPTQEEVIEATGKIRESGLLFLAGVLFAIPGFISDVAGAILALPIIRRMLASRMPREGAGPTTVIRGETVIVDDTGDIHVTTWGTTNQPESEGPTILQGQILPPQRPPEPPEHGG